MDPKQSAADALMEALEEWARSLGEAGVRRSDGARYFPSRQIDRTMRKAHSEGRLFEALTDWLPTYRGLRTSSGGSVREPNARTSSSTAARCGSPSSPKFGDPGPTTSHPKQRRMLRRVAADVQHEINRWQHLRAQIRADMRARPGRDASKHAAGSER